MEAGCVDEDYRLSIEGEFITQLDFRGIRFRSRFGTKVGVCSHVDELNRGSVYGQPVARHPYRSLAASSNPHDAVLMVQSWVRLSPVITHAMVMGGGD